jgi:hypothetical protein
MHACIAWDLKSRYLGPGTFTPSTLLQSTPSTSALQSLFSYKFEDIWGESFVSKTFFQQKKTF